MNWLEQNRFAFLIGPGVCALAALWFLCNARDDWNNAVTRYTRTLAELSRLEELAPFPSEENLRQMRVHADDYKAAVVRLKEELRAYVAPVPSLAPNEFQSRLRVTAAATAKEAQAKGVQLPDKFYLGFDTFASSLPTEAEAPLLGQELAQIEWFLSVLIDARVESLISFRRAPLATEHEASVIVSTDPAVPKLFERDTVEVTFVSTPVAARKVLNQIAVADGRFFIVRLVHIRNEQERGPLREVVAGGGGITRAAAPSVPVDAPGSKSPAGPSLHFIVGNERIETTATIEIVRLPF